MAGGRRAFVACGIVFIVIGLWIIGLCEIALGLSLASAGSSRGGS